MPARAQTPSQFGPCGRIIYLGGDGAVEPLPHLFDSGFSQSNGHHPAGCERQIWTKLPGIGKLDSSLRQMTRKSLPALLRHAFCITRSARPPCFIDVISTLPT